MASLPRTRVTLRDVAREAHVSLSTASRAARNHAAVDPGTRERVLAAIDALGYRVDAAARSVRTGQSLAIGFVVSDISNPLFATIARAADDALREAGYSLVVVNSDNDPAREQEALRLLHSRRIDGLVISLADETSTEAAAALRGLPVVLLDRELRLPSADCICSEHGTGMREALTHLAGLGHRRVAFVGGSLRQYGSRARVDAFRALRAELALDADERLLRVGDHSSLAGYRAARELLALPDRPTALVAGNNQILRGVLEALHEQAVQIPGDLSLVACDDVDICRLYRPPLDVIGRDVAELGRTAATTLLDRLQHPRPTGRRISLPVHFEPRASSAPPATT